MAIKFKPATPAPRETKPPKPSRKGIGGRPAKADKLVAVTLRLPPDVVERFKAKGEDWRAQMARTLSLPSDPA
jgi:uncharacterized protein (DUF4415 family)